MAITGGFGTMIDLERGTSRQWVMGHDGVKRWADSGAPCDPDCRSCRHCDPKWKDYSQLPICQHPEADRGFDDQLGRERGNWALYSMEKSGHCGPTKKHFEAEQNKK